MTISAGTFWEVRTAMLRRDDILRALADPRLDKNRCWVTTGAAMVLRGLRETTRDIDMGCDSSLADELEAAGVPAKRSPEGLRRFRLTEVIDLSENFARGTVEFIDGTPVVSAADILRLKRLLNRPKDHPDIAVLEAALRSR